jgi:hypothetical protein
MSQTVENIIKNDCESQVLDFKLEPYQLGNLKKKHELLKDFCAFVNNPSNHDKYIFVGVQEKNGMAIGFKSVQNEFDEAAYQQYLYQNLEPTISFEYKSFRYQNYNLSYFRIFDNTQRPYLFKRNIINPVNQNVIFRIGDGLIRRGTSTEKITRDDLEKIYATRYQNVDRKSDLDIISYIEKSNEDIISDFNLNFFDVKIENRSSKSIGFDIELKIRKTEGLIVLTSYDAKIELRRLQQEANSVITRSGLGSIYYPELNPFNISIDNIEDHFIATLMLLRDKTNSVILNQKSKDESIFNKEIILITTAPVTVSGEIVLRSDSFTEGPLIKEFSLSIDKSILIDNY